MEDLKSNSIGFGLILGFLGPILTLLIIYFFAAGDVAIRDYIRQLIFFNVYTHIISLSVLPNLLTFFLFIWRNKLRSGRGVLMATIILALVVLGMKLIA